MSDIDNPLAGLKPGELADSYGKLKPRYKKLEAEFNALKAELERRGLTDFKGEKFLVHKRDGGFEGLDIVAAKKAMGAAWCEKYKKWQSRTYYDVSKVDAEKADLRASKRARK